MASPDLITGPGPATIARLGFELAGAINRLIGGGISRADKRALETARSSGYQRERRGWIAPDGTRVTEREVILAGYGILTPTPTPTIPPPTTAPPGNLPVPQPPPPEPLGGGRRDIPRKDRSGGGRTTRRGGRVKDPRPPSRGFDPRARTTLPEPQFRRFPGRIINPNLPYEVTARSIPLLLRVLGAVGGLLYPSPTSSTDTILGRPPGSQRGPTQRPRIRPRPDDQALPTPAPPVAPLPRPTPQPPAVSVPLEVPQIWQQPIPQPTPTPTPTPTSSPTSSPTTSSPFNPLTLAPLALLLPTPGGRPSRLTDPLTPTNPLTPTPTPNAPPRSPPPKFPTPGLTPFQPPGLGSRPSQSDRCKPCRCKRPRKKKRKKREPRTVCYAGTFTETRSSTLKLRKRKIPCR